MVLSILRVPVFGAFSLAIFVLLLPVLSWAQSAEIEALRWRRRWFAAAVEKRPATHRSAGKGEELDVGKN